MFLVVGLGNFGDEYLYTRHNTGFMAADKIICRFSFDEGKKKFKSVCYTGNIAGEKVFLIKPQTYMNLSGEAVGEISRFYHIPPENILVIHDDMDLPVATFKMKKGGGSGGHNGLKSIDSHIGPDYYRLRIGIGHPLQRSDVVDYVLHRFSKEEAEAISDLTDKLAENLPVFIKDGKDAFLNTLRKGK